ncbi:hypothetical protein A9Z05_32675 [Burkholderia sp. A2]|nr:hypothetical protein A9Z05_32675 [Burkholderia sp. A2]
MVMHAGTQIDETPRTLDQCGKYVGRQRVDREDVRQAVARDAMPFTVTDRGVMDYGVEVTQGVDLLRDVFGASNRFHITDDDRLRLGQCAPCVFCAVGIARVQHNLVPLLYQQFGSHQAEASGRTGNEDARHVVSPEMSRWALPMRR